MNKIGVDLGGTKIEIMLSGNDPQDIKSRERVPTEREKGYESVLNKVAGLIKKYQKLSGEPATIGLGMPGSPSPTDGLIRNANTECLNGKPFAKDLENLVGQRVYIANDANCLALSEAMIGIAKGYSSVVGIILGTGVGSGVIINGRMLIGANGDGGEFGHSTLVKDGFPCWCGKLGCVEQYLSGPSFARIYKEVSGVEKTAKEIYPELLKGEAHALETKKIFLDYFKVGMANIIQIIDPSAIVLGGGVSNMDFLYTEGKELVAEYLSDPFMEFALLKNKLGDSSGIFGAALLPDMRNE